jgi:hypothetical protein
MVKRTTAFVLGVLLLSISTAFAQQGAGRGPMMYDTKTETKLAGTVEEVKIGAGMAGHHPDACCAEMGAQGTHVMLKTDKETIEVMLGPSFYLREHKIELVKGDSVEVVGSRITMMASPALIAREIRKGETSVTLRDPNGRPLWRMGYR